MPRVFVAAVAEQRDANPTGPLGSALGTTKIFSPLSYDDGPDHGLAARIYHNPAGRLAALELDGPKHLAVSRSNRYLVSVGWTEKALQR